MYDTGITPLGPDNGPDRVGDREKRVVEVVRIVGRGHTNLLKRLNKACDAFVDPKLTFPPKPAHIRLQRDPEDTYLRAKPYKPVYQNRGQKYTGHKARTQVG